MWSYLPRRRKVRKEVRKKLNQRKCICLVILKNPSWIWSSKLGLEKYKDKLKGKSNKERGKLMEDKFKLEDKETIDAIW